MRIMGRSIDVGMVWGRWLYTYSQAGSVQGGINTVMLFVVTYSTSVKGIIPAWLYVLLIAMLISTLVIFVSKIGVAGYFRFYKKQSAVGYIEEELKRQGELLDAMKVQLDSLTTRTQENQHNG